MILYNTTFCLDHSIRDEFVRYITDTVIPATICGGMYGHILGAIRADDERNGITGDNTVSYAFQMRAPSQEVLDAVISSILSPIWNRLAARWPAKVAMFDTAIDIIHSQNDPVK